MNRIKKGNTKYLITYLLMHFIFLQSCNQNKDELFKRDYKLICKEVNLMADSDQLIRSALVYGTWDTLEWKKLDDSVLINPSIYDTIIGEFVLNNERRDSISRYMGETQKRYTERLMKIIDKYGYPSQTRIGDTTNRIMTDILLAHLYPIDKEQQLKILREELKTKRMSDNQFGIAEWNLNLRKGIPKLKGIELIIRLPNGKDSVIKN
jgi:hypothetical protein